MDAVAKDLASALESKAVRELVKQETGKLLVGQHNVLYRTIASMNVQTGSKEGPKTFQQVLAQQRTSSSVSSKAFNRVVESVRLDARTIPKFDIGVPVHHDVWNPEDMIPLVAFHHKNQVDDMELDRRKAYDAEGNVHWLDAEEAPDRPVVVVGINERTTAEGKVKASMASRYNADGKLIVGGGGGGGGSTGPYYSNNPRTDGASEYIEEWTCKDDEERWDQEGAEIYALYIGVSDRDARIEDAYLGELDDGSTRTVDQFIFDWDFSQFGDEVGVHWYEADGGSITTHQIELLQTTYLFEHGDKGDDLGSTGLSTSNDANVKRVLSKVDFVPAWED